jgi:hypothetical protein
MKKFIIVFTMMVLSTALFAQKSAIQSAFNYQKNGKLDKAKEFIDKAAEHEKTIGDPKAWYYRGNIYIDIYNSPLEAYRELDADPLAVAYDSYQRAIELDEKKAYTDDIVAKMPGLGELFFNEGARRYNAGIEAQNNLDSLGAKRSFGESVEAFEQAYTIYTTAGIIDTTTIYYVSIAAELAGDYDKAKLKLVKLIEMQYPKSGIYSSLATIYYEQDNDLNKAIETYALGRERFPNDLNLLLMETNLFLGESMTEEALENLQQAARIDTTNPTIFFAIGAKYNEVVDDTSKTEEMRKDAFEKAVIAYKKSIELKPDYFDPNYNIGALYVNRASSVISIANELPLEEQERYDALMEEANNFLESCLPYLEKAHELQPEDISTMVSLKEIYTRLGMSDKMKEIDAEIEEQ